MLLVTLCATPEHPSRRLFCERSSPCLTVWLTAAGRGAACRATMSSKCKECAQQIFKEVRSAFRIAAVSRCSFLASTAHPCRDCVVQGSLC